jgi:hypothetical protein
MKGHWTPDENQKKAKDYDKLENLSTSNTYIRTSIEYVQNVLFNYVNNNHFQIENAENPWKQFFEKSFLNDYNCRELYSPYYDLVGFLRAVFYSTIVYGKAFYAVDYADNNGCWLVKSIHWLPVETMTPNYDQKGVIKGFTQKYSSKGNDEIKNYRMEFLPEEIFFVEWNFDGDKKGVSPLLRLYSNANREKELWDFMQRKFYAQTHQDDHSLSVEQARYAPFEEAKKQADDAKIKNISKIGGLLDVPMTEYYYAYYFAKNRKRIAMIREYLVNDFNTQIVATLSRKNGLTEIPKIAITNYLTSEQIESHINDFKKAKITSDQLIKLLLEDKTQNSDS